MSANLTSWLDLLEAGSDRECRGNPAPRSCFFMVVHAQESATQHDLHVWGSSNSMKDFQQRRSGPVGLRGRFSSYIRTVREVPWASEFGLVHPVYCDFQDLLHSILRRLLGALL